MKPLKFYYAKAVNLMCFGEDGIEIYFTDHGNIVCIKGINLDNPGTDAEPASNASGKSTIQEIISIALYGESVKDLKKNEQLVNRKTEGNLWAEVRFDDFRVVRTINRKSGAQKLRIWESKDHIWDDTTEYDKAGINEMQAKINKAVGLSHTAFCCVAIFDDSDQYAFLGAEAKDKREIIENLLGLSKYREYCETAKALLKAKKDEIVKLSKEYSKIKDDLTGCDGRIEKAKLQQQTWKANKELEVKTLALEIQKKQTELEKTDLGAALAKYQQVQEQIATLQNEVGLMEERIKRAENNIAEAQKTLETARDDKQGFANSIRSISADTAAIQKIREASLKLLTELKSLTPGARCPTCHGVINRDNYDDVIVHEEQTIDETAKKIEAERAKAIGFKEEYDKKVAYIAKFEANIADAKGKISASKQAMKDKTEQIKRLSAVSKPDSMDTVTQVLEAKITELKKQQEAKQEELKTSPYTEILVDAESDKENKKKEVEAKAQEIKDVEELIPYYEYWVKAFGDNGIRKLIVDGIIPALNARINYWLQYLIENKIEVNFDNMLSETILRNGTPVDYKGMSKSEKRRVNLAISQAFAYIMMVNCGTYPSIVFLDEITGGIDKYGVSGVYAMIIELAKERQVLVTTHDQTLLSFLQGCETIMLQKQDDITTLLT